MCEKSGEIMVYATQALRDVNVNRVYTGEGRNHGAKHD